MLTQHITHVVLPTTLTQTVTETQVCLLNLFKLSAFQPEESQANCASDQGCRVIVCNIITVIAGISIHNCYCCCCCV